MKLACYFSNKRLCLRWAVAVILIALPLFLFNCGIYGSFLFTFSIAFFWQIVILGRPLSSLGVHKNNLAKSVIGSLITTACIVLCAVLIFNYVGLRAFNFKETGALEFSLAKTEINFPLSGELGYQLLMQSNTLAGGIKYLLFCLFLVGLGEEIFWRGLIQQRLMSYLDKHVSVFLTAILFSSLHFYLFQILSLRLGIVLLVLIAFVGIIWGYLFWHYKNIWAPAISHGIVAFVVWKYLFFSNGS